MWAEAGVPEGNSTQLGCQTRTVKRQCNPLHCRVALCQVRRKYFGRRCNKIIKTSEGERIFHVAWFAAVTQCRKLTNLFPVSCQEMTRRAVMNINSFPLRVGCCVFASQPQLISNVVGFVTVTLTGIREHQRQILHFPTAKGQMILNSPPSAPPGQPTGLTARRLAALSRTETPGAPRQRRAPSLVWDQRERRASPAFMTPGVNKRSFATFAR